MTTVCHHGTRAPHSCRECEEEYARRCDARHDAGAKCSCRPDIDLACPVHADEMLGQENKYLAPELMSDGDRMNLIRSRLDTATPFQRDQDTRWLLLLVERLQGAK